MIQLLNEEPPEYDRVRIHRDYHPSNLLWQADKVTGVVDWINSCLGPAGVDLSHCRVNLAFLHGIEAADALLNAYKVEVGANSYYDRYWDLRAFADFVYPGPPDVYRGWTDMGISWLDERIMVERADRYLIHLLKE